MTSYAEKLQKLMDENPEFSKSMKNMHEEYISELRKQLNVPEDWKYTRTRLSEKDWEEFLEIVGEEEIVIVSGNTMNDITEMSFFFSPLALHNAEIHRQSLGV